MLEPGCTIGRRISSRPVVGPLLSRRKSLAIRTRSWASVRIAPEKNTASCMDCIDSKRLSLSYSLKPVRRDSVLTIRR